MENDERDREWPEEDRGPEPVDPEGSSSQPADPEGSSPDEPRQGSGEAWSRSEDQPMVRDEPEPTDEPVASAAEIESWPSQEAAAAPAEPADDRGWPTEPPTAASAPADAWPTSAPEQGASPVGSSGEAVDERPPQEVEAYSAPDAGAAEADAAERAAAVAPAHSVPDAEGTTGESTQCPRCGTENRPGLSFCRNCGQRLVAAGVSSTVERPGVPEGTQGCPRCGTHNRAGVAFCQNCGANLRGTAAGYVPPAVAGEREAAAAEPARRGAVLGPVVLLIGLAGLVTAYLLPFLYGSNSLFERAVATDGYGIAFWEGYPDVSASLADQAYFGLAGPMPLLGILLLALAIAGFVRAAPGLVQTIGLGLALLWSVGLIVLFVVVELAGNWDGDLVGMLRVLTPAGIIFFLSSLIVLIGTLTRFGRS